MSQPDKPGKGAFGSLNGHLLRWLLLPLFVLWLADAVLTNQRSIDQVNVGFDRTLMGSALMVSDRVTTRNGELTVDVPYAAFEMLEAGFHERIFYQVTDLERSLVLTGYEDLPAPPQRPVEGKPIFFTADYKGEEVRIVALLRHVYDPDVKGPVLIEMAETTDARQALSRRLLLESVVKELASIALVGLLVWLGIRRGLAPLNALRRQVAARADDDLTPISSREVPREVAPLIETINTQTSRQLRMNATQREFVADASHQLKTPLTVLKTQAELALRQSDPQRMREIVEAMLASTDNTARVVHQLLALARSDPAHVFPSETFDVAQLLRDTTLALMPAALAKRIDLGYEGEDAASVAGQRGLIQELLTNLIDNAIRYTPDGGCITVRALPGDGVVRLQVEDNGPGIAPAERRRITERFYRPAGSSGDGCGLGLAIAAEICRRHAASLTFGEGPTGQGLLVEVVFPVAAGEAPAPGQ